MLLWNETDNTLPSVPDSLLHLFHWDDFLPFHPRIQRVGDRKNGPIRTKPQPKLLWWSRGSLDLFNERFLGRWSSFFKGGFVTSQEHHNEKSWKPWKVTHNHTTLSDVCLMRLEFSEVQEKLGWSQILWHGKDVMMKGSLHEESLWQAFWKMMQQK